MLYEEFRSVLAGRNLGDMTYDELLACASKAIEFAVGGPADLAESPSDAAGIKDWAAYPAAFASRTHLPSFLRCVGAGSKLAQACVDLFLMARQRRLVAAYLSIQEGLDLDVQDASAPRIAKVIRELLGNLGKRPLFGMGVRWRRIRFVVSCDPFVHLRYIYYLNLQRGRRQSRPLGSWLSMRRHLALFRLRAFLARMILLWACAKASRGDPRLAIEKLLQSNVLQRNLSLALLLLFPEARDASPSEWRLLLARIEEYFEPKLNQLLNALRPDSIRRHGLVKHLKIGLGVVMWRSHSTPAEGDVCTHIFNTLRLAYSWGSTYPLIDNVLDSQETSARVRHELVVALGHLFADDIDGQEMPPLKDAGVQEAYQRIAEVLTFIPAQELRGVKNTLRLLLESHARNAAHRLCEFRDALPDDVESAMWQENLIKAAMIRCATMRVSGVPVATNELTRQFLAALLNQTGDDLWDLYEDLDSNALTPFTAYAKGLVCDSPFLSFIRYAYRLARESSPLRSRSLSVGVQETMGCLLRSIDDREADELDVIPRMLAVLASTGFPCTAHSIRLTPHVDPDAVLFKFEEAFLECGGFVPR
jgi:hypothetical protein